MLFINNNFFSFIFQNFIYFIFVFFSISSIFFGRENFHVHPNNSIPFLLRRIIESNYFKTVYTIIQKFYIVCYVIVCYIVCYYILYCYLHM